jgi:inorganic pyrophosphatase
VLSAVRELAPFERGKVLHVIVETTRGSRYKYAFDEATGLIALKKALPTGMAFPFDFGFVPGTRAGDGDPLDVVLLSEEPTFAGCLVKATLLGVMRARQRKKGGPLERNDRLLAAPRLEHGFTPYRALKDVPKALLDETERFFVTYSSLEGKRFEVLGVSGAAMAWELVKRSRRRE